MKKFNEWNEVKKETEHIAEKVYFKERDIFISNFENKNLLEVKTL